MHISLTSQTGIRLSQSARFGIRKRLQFVCLLFTFLPAEKMYLPREWTWLPALSLLPSFFPLRLRTLVRRPVYSEFFACVRTGTFFAHDIVWHSASNRHLKMMQPDLVIVFSSWASGQIFVHCAYVASFEVPMEHNPPCACWGLFGCRTNPRT